MKSCDQDFSTKCARATGKYVPKHIDYTCKDSKQQEQPSTDLKS